MDNIFKIIAPPTQGDVRLGSRTLKGKNKIAIPNTPPDSVYGMLPKPPVSMRQELMLSEGHIHHAQALEDTLCYLKFSKISSYDLGIHDPMYRDTNLKQCLLVKPPAYTEKQFIEAINWIYNYMSSHKNGVIFEHSTRLYAFKNGFPTQVAGPLPIPTKEIK